MTKQTQSAKKSQRRRHQRAVAGGTAKARKDHNGAVLDVGKVINAFYFLTGKGECNVLKALKFLSVPPSSKRPLHSQQASKYSLTEKGYSTFDACKVLADRLGYSITHIKRVVQSQYNGPVKLSMLHNFNGK